MLYLTMLVKPTYHVNYIQADINTKFFENPFDKNIFPMQSHPNLGATYRYTSTLFYGLFAIILGSEYPYTYLYLADTVSIIVTVLLIIIVGKELKNYLVGIIAGTIYIIYPSVYDWFARVGVYDFHMILFLMITFWLILKYYKTNNKSLLLTASTSYFLCLNTRETSYVAIPVLMYLICLKRMCIETNQINKIKSMLKDSGTFLSIPVVGVIILKILAKEQEITSNTVSTMIQWGATEEFFHNMFLYFSSGLLGPVLLLGTALWISFKLYLLNKKKVLKNILYVSLVIGIFLGYATQQEDLSLFTVVFTMSIIFFLITLMGFLWVFNFQNYSFLIVWFTTYVLGLSIMFRTDQIMDFLPSLSLIFALITHDSIDFNAAPMTRILKWVEKISAVIIILGLLWYGTYFTIESGIKQSNRVTVGVFAEKVLNDAKQYYDRSKSLILCQYEVRPMSPMRFTRQGYTSFTLGLYEGNEMQFVLINNTQEKQLEIVQGNADKLYAALKNHGIKYALTYAQGPCGIFAEFAKNNGVKLVKTYEQPYRGAVFPLLFHDVLRGKFPPQLFVTSYIERIYLLEIK